MRRSALVRRGVLALLTVFGLLVSVPTEASVSRDVSFKVDPFAALPQLTSTPIAERLAAVEKNAAGCAALCELAASIDADPLGYGTKARPFDAVVPAFGRQYQYAHDNPTYFMDPTGHSAWSTAWKVIKNGGHIASAFDNVTKNLGNAAEADSFRERLGFTLAAASELLPISAQDTVDIYSAFQENGGLQTSATILAASTRPGRAILGGQQVIGGAGEILEGNVFEGGKHILQGAAIGGSVRPKSSRGTVKGITEGAEAEAKAITIAEKRTATGALGGAETVGAKVEAPNRGTYVGRQRFDATGLSTEQVERATLKSIRRASGAQGNAAREIEASADQMEFILRKATSWRRDVHASRPGMAELPPELKGTRLHSSVQSRVETLNVRDLIVNQRLYGSSPYTSPVTGQPYEFRIPDFRMRTTIFDIKPVGTPLAGPQYNDFRSFSGSSDVRWIPYQRY